MSKIYCFEEHFVIESNRRQRKYFYRDIYFISIQDGLVELVNRANESNRIHISFRYMCESLKPFGFRLCHRNYLVNLSFVKTIDLRHKKIILSIGKDLPLARRRIQSITSVWASI